MKKLLTFVLAFLAISAFAQKNSSYITTGDVNLQECDKKGALVAGNIRFVPSGSKFTIVDNTSDSYIVRFWRWTPDQGIIAKYSGAGVVAPAAGTKEYYYLENANENKQYFEKLNKDVTNDLVRYFLIDKGDLESYAAPIVSTVSPIYGAVVMPFKARPQNGFDFTKDLSISGMGGVRFSDPLGKRSLSLLLGIGIASVTLNAENTKNTITTAEDRAAITVPVGVVLQLRKLQFGIFTGLDFLSQSNKNNWVHQNKPWLSLGIGFTIFSEQEAPKKEGTN